MSAGNIKRNRIIGLLLILTGIFLIVFSIVINIVAKLSFLALGIMQFIEFSSGSLLLYCGIFFLIFAALSAREILIRIGLTVGSLLVSIVLLELLLQLVMPRPQFDTRLMLYPHIRRQIRVDLPGISPHGQVTTNSWGMRGDEPPAEWDAYHTIITIGGSTTFCALLDDSRTWAAILQSNLNESVGSTWVGNAGIDGHSTRAHLLMMREVIAEVRPDMLIFLVGINDFGASLSNSDGVYGTLADRTDAPIVFKSYLFRFAWQLAHLVAGNVVSTQDAHQALNPVPVDTTELTPLPDDLRDALPLLDTYRANLNSIIDIGEELDIEMLFLTQPLHYDDTDYWQDIEGTTPWLRDQNIHITAATFWNMLDQFNQVLLEVCEERDVTCYDLASNVPHSADYFYDIAHFTEAGSALVAQEITPIVEEILTDE